MMGLKKYLSRLFRKKRKNVTGSALACIRSIVEMPKREDYINDVEAQTLIDSYKKEYLKTLKVSRTIVSIDLMPKELQEFKNIYTDLLARLCTEDNSDVSFEKIDANSSELLNIMIIKLKLDLYINEVRAMENVAKLRIVALTEILNSTYFSRNKESAINNEIDNLCFSIATFETQVVAMEKEKERFLKDLNNLDLEEFKSAEEEQILISKYLAELKLLASSVIPEKLKELEKLNLSPILFVAKLEQLLEIYVYTHENTIDSLKEEVDTIAFDISGCVLGGTIEDFWNKVEELESKRDDINSKYLKRIKGIELLFKLFSKYSRNKIFKSDLKKLYEVKFKLLTYYIFDEKFNILDNITFTELECYQDIVFRKIEQILKGNNKYVNDLSIKSDLKTVINHIKSVLKIDNKEFSMYDILKNRRVLSFLLAFDTYNGLEEFFSKERAFKIEYSNLNFYDRDIFEWEEILPLDTIYRITRSNIKTEPNSEELKRDSLRDSLYYLHPLQKEFNKTDYYTLPEGLKKINIITFGGEASPLDLVNYIRSLAKNKKVKMPSTLKEFHGKLFEDTSIISLELNEGLQRIDSYALSAKNLQGLSIPSTIHFGKKLFDALPNTLKIITINNYKNNGYLENIVHYVAAKTFRIEYINVTHFITTVDELIFLDEEGKVDFILTKKDLMFSSRDISQDLSIEEAIPELEEKITNIIRNQSGQSRVLKK